MRSREGIVLNGVIAAAFWTSTLLNPDYSILNGFPENEVTAYNSVMISSVEFQRETIGKEIGFKKTNPVSFGPLQPVSAISVTEKNGVWAGYGFYNEVISSDLLSIGFSFIPGLYYANDEVDLGGWLMFRSGVHLNIKLADFWRLSLGFDHRSSGDLWQYNPGMETFQLGLEKKINK